MVIMIALPSISSIAFSGIKLAMSTGKWSVASTWSPSGIPTASDTVIVANNANVKVDTDGTCAAVQLGSSATSSNGHGSLGFLPGSSLFVTGTLTLGSQGPGSTSSSGTVTMSSGGTLNCGGLVDAYKGSFNSGQGTLILHADNTVPETFTTFNNLEISSGTTTLSASSTVKGSVTLSGGLFTIGIYDILSQGDWTFSGGSLNSSSTVTLGGTTAQHISGSANFCLLTIDNAIGVTSGSVGVSQNLALTRGILTASGTLTCGTASGGNDTSYVDGTLAQNVSGADTFYFPVGNHGYSPVKVVATSGGNMLAIAAIDGLPPSAPGLNVLSRYWSVGGSGVTVDMVFQYPASDVNGTESAYEGGRYNGLGWDFLPGFADPSSHTVTLPGVDNFNYMTLGDPGSLPIQVTSVKAVQSAPSEVTLSWSTLTETNNLGFIVQRRPEGSSAYTAISGLIAGAGTSLESHDYSFVDSHLATGTYYYRIQQKDVDGTTSASAEIKIVVAGVLAAEDLNHPATFQLAGNYPNPFNPTTTIAFEVPEQGRATITVYNLMGQEVATLLNNAAVAAGDHAISFDAHTLASGRYFYRVDFAGEHQQVSGVRSMVLIK